MPERLATNPLGQATSILEIFWNVWKSNIPKLSKPFQNRLAADFGGRPGPCLGSRHVASGHLGPRHMGFSPLVDSSLVTSPHGISPHGISPHGISPHGVSPHVPRCCGEMLWRQSIWRPHFGNILECLEIKLSKT